MKCFKKIFSVVCSMSLGFIFNGSSYAMSADNVNKSVSIEKKLGRLMCISLFKESKIYFEELDETLKSDLKKLNIKNFILYKGNINQKEKTEKFIKDLKGLDSEGKVLVAVDQEGGIVERFSFGRKERLKNNIDITSDKEAYEKGKVIGTECKNLGINCDFAPVADVNSNPKNPVIGKRSFGSDTKVVSSRVIEFTKGLRESGVLATAKHFPGHGDTSEDSHIGLPVVNKTKEELEKCEFVPFKSIIDSGIDLIMTAHIQFPKLDSSTIDSKNGGKKITVPATLSKKILTNLLREEMKFKGIVVSDSMSMGAIVENFGMSEACVMAIKAGVDVVLINDSLENIKKVYSDIVNQAKKDKELESRINESYDRMLKLKYA